MSEADNEKFAALIEPVARELWGEPTKGTITNIGMRFGSQGSKSIVLKEGKWFDHESFVGGNVIELVMHVENTDKAGALRWLEEKRFIEPRQPRQVKEERPARTMDQPEHLASPEQAEAKKVMVEAYDYVNRDGERLYQVVRFQFQLPDGSWLLGKSGNPKKTFAQRRKNERGEVVWNLDGIGHTIYRHNLVEAAIADGKTVFMPEGEKDVHTLEGWGLVATTNSGGAANWKPHLAQYFNGADIVILGDDDEPGRKRVDDIARSLRGIAARVRAIYSWGGPKDVTDWKDAGGTAEQLVQIMHTLPDWKPRPPQGFGGRSMISLAGKPIEYDWLIKGLVERNGVFILAAEKQAGKSFVVMDMGMKIARGLQYGDRITRKGIVIHVACEDGKGVQMRAEGYRQANGISPDTDIPYVVMTHGFTLMDDKVIDQFIATVKEWEEFYGLPVELIIIDTLSVATEGLNEIDGAEVGKVLARVNRLKDATHAAICLVHHMNASGGRVRGHTSIEANVSQVFEIRPLMTIPNNRRETPQPIMDAQGRHIRQIVLTKNKNGLNNLKWRIVLEVVKLGFDADGDEITTCVCTRPARSASGSEGQDDTTKLVGDQKLVFDALVTAQADKGIDRPEGVSAPPQIRKCVSQQDFVAAVRKVINFTAGEEEIEARNKELQAFLKRTTTALINAGYMGRDNDKRVCWWTEKSDRPRPRREEPPPPEDTRPPISVTEAPF